MLWKKNFASVFFFLLSNSKEIKQFPEKLQKWLVVAKKFFKQ